MILAVDIETQGLNATKFLCGATMKETGKKELFYDKNELWNYIINLGYKERRRKRTLTVYAHNHEFDFYGYADLNDSNIVINSTNPFIVSYIVDGKVLVKFLDSMSLYRALPLSKVGEIIGLEKLDMPKEFLEGKKVSRKRLKELSDYVFRDVEIVMAGVLYLRRKLQNEGIRIQKLMSISQIAIKYLLQTLRKSGEYDDMFFNKEMEMLVWTKYSEEIHSAYRGGRVECFSIGKFDNVNYIDVNNLYGYCSTIIDFPNLKTERKVRRPLELMDLGFLLDRIGISRVLIYNKKCELGVLPIRTPNGNYFPKRNKYLIGTYTHIELREAIKQGYKILDIEWSILWEKTKNPFKEITSKLYKLRAKRDNTDFDKWFYKQMQNCSYGKLAQKRDFYEIILRNIEETPKLEEEGFEVADRKGYNYLFKRLVPSKVPRKYYAPIIPTLINAYARVYMFKQFKKIPKSDLIYTDTDSVIFKGDHIKSFKVCNELGCFKLEGQGGFNIKAKKTYRFNNEVKIAGFRKKKMTPKEFDKGKSKSVKMITVKTIGSSEDDWGRFVNEIRDLNKQTDKHLEYEEMMENQKVYKDYGLNNIDYFVEKLNSITI